MSEEQKLIAEMAARFMLAVIQHQGPTRDGAYVNQCVEHATSIVKQATKVQIGGEVKG